MDRAVDTSDECTTASGRLQASWTQTRKLASSKRRLHCGHFEYSVYYSRVAALCGR